MSDQGATPSTVPAAEAAEHGVEHGPSLASALAAAVMKDFGHRCPEETTLLEIFTSVDGIRYNRKKLAKWMKPIRRSVSPLFFTGRNTLLPQPKGLVGIVVPYMIPLVLLLVALEEAGVMARIAFAVDRTFHRIGLHGGVAVPTGP